MALTYTALASTTVGSGGSPNIQFTNIPQTYTDLVLKVYGRFSFFNGLVSSLAINFNGSNSNWTARLLNGNGSSSVAFVGTNPVVGYLPAALSSGSIFGSSDIYISRYAENYFKSVTTDTVSEDNGTVAWSSITALLWSNTSPVTSITLYDLENSSNFIQNSTAVLYGIKNTV